MNGYDGIPQLRKRNAWISKTKLRKQLLVELTTCVDFGITEVPLWTAHRMRTCAGPFETSSAIAVTVGWAIMDAPSCLIHAALSGDPNGE